MSEGVFQKQVERRSRSYGVIIPVVQRRLLGLKPGDVVEIRIKVVKRKNEYERDIVDID